MCHPSEYGCGHPAHHAFGGCCAHGWAPWRIPTKEETMRWLEEHLSLLRAEAKRVEERIAELKKG